MDPEDSEHEDGDAVAYLGGTVPDDGVRDRHAGLEIWVGPWLWEGYQRRVDASPPRGGAARVALRTRACLQRTYVSDALALVPKELRANPRVTHQP